MIGGGGYYLQGFAPSEPGLWIWAQPVRHRSEFLDNMRGGFSIDLPSTEGVLFGLGFGSLYKQRTITSSLYDVLESPSGALSGAGQGDLAVWTDYGLEHQRVRGWAPDGGGLRTIIENPPFETCHLQVSPTSIVALALNGTLSPSETCPPADEAALWRSPRAYDTSEASVEVGPSLGLPPSILHVLATWGDYAALRVHPIEYVGDPISFIPLDRQQYYLVIRLSDFAAFRIDVTSGYRIGEIAGLDDRYFYFGETTTVPPAIQRLLRIELSRIAEYGARL
jgi:hypothetical protein